MAVRSDGPECRSPTSGGIPRMFKLSTEFIELFFSEVSAFQFDFLLSSISRACLNESGAVALRGLAVLLHGTMAVATLTCVSHFACQRRKYYNSVNSLSKGTHKPTTRTFCLTIS